MVKQRWVPGFLMGLVWTFMGFLGTTLQARDLVFIKPQAMVFAGNTVLAVETPIKNRDIIGLEIFVNDRSVYYEAHPPFETQVDFRAFPSGRLEIRAVLTLFDGSTREATIHGENIANFMEEEVAFVRVPVFVQCDDGVDAYQRLHIPFELRENGVPQALQSVLTHEAPMHVVVVIDTSGSMERILPLVKRGCRAFLDKLSPADQVQLIGFNHHVYEISGFEADKEALKGKLYHLSAKGDTNLHGAVWCAVRSASKMAGRRAVLVFTDGHQEIGPGTVNVLEKELDECIQLANEFGVPVFAIGVGLDVEPEVLTSLAAKTGGEAFIIRKGGQIQQAFETIGHQMEFQFLLSYYTQSRQYGWHRIQVSVPGWPHLYLRYPKQIFFK